jgi:uncharacterized protein (TIGR02453 family)
MNAKRILLFLKDIAANNNREWFLEHKAEYDEIRKDFESDVALAIARLSTFDPSLAHLTVKDTTYRFYRDIRFSPDKSPYKRHLGAYIAAHGKKSLHGGYYFHLEPGNCMVACGNYYLPTNILNAVRNTIINRIDDFRPLVENDDFHRYFPDGFGNERLKTCPAGFPKDFPYMDYLRAKDYCCWHPVDDDFFEGEGWLDEFENICRTAKPLMDFANDVIDDYE